MIAWLHDKMPADHPRPGIVHNDYRFDNVILDAENPMRIIGVLDWEMTTLGDPLMDLGNSLAYWIEANDPPPVQLMRRQPSNAPGMLTRRQFVDYYAERAGIHRTISITTIATACSVWPESSSRSTTASTMARPRTNALPSSST